MKGIKVDYMLIASIILSFIIITASFVNFAYSQASQMSSNSSNEGNTNANTPNIQDIPAKKVHVGDIDIAYKTFGPFTDKWLLLHHGQLGLNFIRNSCFQSYCNRF